MSNPTRTPAETHQISARLAYELGAAAGLVKFAADYPENVRPYFYAKLLPDHQELLALFRETGAQVAAQS